MGFHPAGVLAGFLPLLVRPTWSWGTVTSVAALGALCARLGHVAANREPYVGAISALTELERGFALHGAAAGGLPGGQETGHSASANLGPLRSVHLHERRFRTIRMFSQWMLFRQGMGRSLHRPLPQDNLYLPSSMQDSVLIRIGHFRSMRSRSTRISSASPSPLRVRLRSADFVAG